jgi:hypothetical protein
VGGPGAKRFCGASWVKMWASKSLGPMGCSQGVISPLSLSGTGPLVEGSNLLFFQILFQHSLCARTQGLGERRRWAGFLPVPVFWWAGQPATVMDR